MAELLADLEHERRAFIVARDAVEDVVRYDGPGHYAEHSAQLRAASR